MLASLAGKVISITRCNQAVSLCLLVTGTALAADQGKTANGAMETTAAPKDGVRSFKGIPFAAPPVAEPPGTPRWEINVSGVRLQEILNFTVHPLKFQPEVVERALEVHH